MGKYPRPYWMRCILANQRIANKLFLLQAGSVKVQVVEMGLASTTVLNSERFPDLVPNSLFSSQVIVNKSRARWRAVVTKIPLQIEDLDKVPEISNEIKSMLKSNSKVFLGKEVPYCFLSHVEGSYAELTVGCNLRHMSKDELYSTHQDILLQSVRNIKKHATLGSTFQCPIVLWDWRVAILHGFMIS
ncbi:hypothetical protein PVK06_044055 [Gossypium arboreum]|uniref:Uncharacterized protein n=1 Tax=Gossypium arboreum TaxID=29729 RepID=A0ABR0MQF0_GOSAR|nr:hypothetical protein PVK06_044055 [Gossypium arboreum]